MPFDRFYAASLLDAQRIAIRFRETAQRAVPEGLRGSPAQALTETLKRNLEEATRLEAFATSKYRTYLESSSTSARR